MSTVDSLDERLDRLYGLEPGSFVAERDRLVRELRSAGERDKADEVKQLRKPSLPAWTINQLARRERREVDLLLDAGHRLLEAQQRLLTGEDPGRLDDARRTERDALAGLHAAARRILAETGRESEGTLARIMGTLQAAAVSNEGRQLLARGRLTGELEATGFELLAPSAQSKPSTRGRAQQRKPKRSQPAQERRPHVVTKRLDQLRGKLGDARSAARAAQTELRAAEQDAGKARRELARAEELVRKTQATVDRAQKSVERAEQQLREAERRAR
ncbi:MAG: hypothetical protein WBB76_13155 [Gaiellaceae bacterium]